MTLEICTGLTVGRRGKVTSEVPRSRIATYKTVISCDQDIITDSQFIWFSYGFWLQPFPYQIVNYTRSEIMISSPPLLVEFHVYFELKLKVYKQEKNYSPTWTCSPKVEPFTNYIKVVSWLAWLFLRSAWKNIRERGVWAKP